MTGKNTDLRPTSSKLYVSEKDGLQGGYSGEDAVPPVLGAMAISGGATTKTAAQQPMAARNTASDSYNLPDLSRSSSRSNISRRYKFAAATTVGLILFGLVVWQGLRLIGSTSIIQDFQQRHNQVMCMNNLSKIAKALNAYAATHGSYPPPITYDEQGKPKHSWRVLILRELGEYALYNQYKFDEPWDSQSNSLLYTKCPSIFCSPGMASTASSAEGNYFLLVGPGTIFPGTRCLKPGEIGDGADATIIVVEAANTIHPWSEPIDVQANGQGLIKMGGCHSNGMAAAKADGESIWIPTDAPQQTIDAFSTANGNEVVEPDVFKR